jgi:hypothetical protein
MDGYVYDDEKRISRTPGGGYTHSSHWIEFATLSETMGERTSEMAFVSARNNIVHELGHAFAKLMYYDSVGPLNNNNIPAGLRVEEGFYPSPRSAMRTWRQHPGDLSPSEIFADMFLGWVYDKWDSNGAGTDKSNFMSLNMPFWISHIINNE